MHQIEHIDIRIQLNLKTNSRIIHFLPPSLLYSIAEALISSNAFHILEIFCQKKTIIKSKHRHKTETSTVQYRRTSVYMKTI